jgi:hypothetical protein
MRKADSLIDVVRYGVHSSVGRIANDVGVVIWVGRFAKFITVLTADGQTKMLTQKVGNDFKKMRFAPLRTDYAKTQYVIRRCEILLHGESYKYLYGNNSQGNRVRLENTLFAAYTLEADLTARGKAEKDAFTGASAADLLESMFERNKMKKSKSFEDLARDNDIKACKSLAETEHVPEVAAGYAIKAAALEASKEGEAP